jgi:DNA-binding protein HU-beta
MTKNELISAIAEEAGKPKTVVSDILVALGNVTTSRLKAGEEVVLGDIAKLKVAKREARTGTNPATGAKVQIAAKNVVKFKASKSLSDAVA